METLEEKKWHEFFLNQIFSVSAGKRLETRNKIPGLRPFIGAADNNNGVTGFVQNENTSKDKNVLGVNYNGAPCIAFYHPYRCLFSDDVKRLHLLQRKDNPLILLFFPAVFAMQKSKYTYGYKFKEQRMLRQKLMLPATSEDTPDYDYMSKYVKQKKSKLLARYTAYVKRRLAELGAPVAIPELMEKEWKDFQLTKIFAVVSRGKRLKKADHISGNIPYISSTAMTNGMDGTCGNSHGVRMFSDCLTIANSGSVGSCFYHPYEFIASDHVTALKCKTYNSYIYLFLSILIGRLKEKYNFNREINDFRIARERIMLPVNDSSLPDYVYMEQYVKNLLWKKYRQYLDFLEAQGKVDTTR